MRVADFRSPFPNKCQFAAGKIASGSPRNEMRFDSSYGAGEISPHENTVRRSTRFDPNRKHHPPPSR